MKKIYFLLTIVIVVLSACSTPPPQEEPEPTSDIEQQLFSIFEKNNLENVETVRELSASGNQQAIVPLVDLLRFPTSQLTREVVFALQSLTGEEHTRWDEWVTYIANRDDIELPSNYLSWKGRLYSNIDPNFQRFLESGKEQAPFFRPELAVWGGVLVAIVPNEEGGIPPLEEPNTIPGSQATFMRDDDRVFGMVVQGQARAYPQRIVDWHEMINDEINGQHYSVAYCTLCGAAIAYDTQLEDGGHLTFSSSGLLYESNKLMFDRQTETLWNHLTGQPVLGPLVNNITELPLLYIETTTWKQWLEQHPDTDVVDINTGFNRDYSFGVPSYNTYYESPETLFPTSDVPGPLQPKDRIFGLYVDEDAKAYHRDAIWEELIVNDEFNDHTVVVISNGLDTGIRGYERKDYEFSQQGNNLIDQQGNQWEITAEALVFQEERLERLPAHEAFWFGWVLNFPETEVYS